MVTRTQGWGRVFLVGTCVVALAATACGSDSDEKSAEKSTTTSSRPAVAAEFQEYCDLAWDLWEQDGTPTPAQLQDAQNIAPAEIVEPVGVAAPPLSAAGDDTVAFFNAYGVDDVTAAVQEIDAWETENCKIPHDPPGAGEGATWELEDGAARVDVTMLEYEFDFAEPVAAGRTSFVGTNAGAQAHFMLLVKLAEGTTLEQALESDDESGIEGQWISGIASAGGQDEEVLTVDLTPGTYGFACFVSGPDGTPHAMDGMVREFTVA